MAFCFMRRPGNEYWFDRARPDGGADFSKSGSLRGGYLARGFVQFHLKLKFKFLFQFQLFQFG